MHRNRSPVKMDRKVSYSDKKYCPKGSIMINILVNFMLFSEWAVGSRVSCGLTYVRLGDESNVVGAGHRMCIGVWWGVGGGRWGGGYLGSVQSG